MAKLFKCSCGRKVDAIRYVNGQKRCNNCLTNNLSGSFLRRTEGELQQYAKDVLQPYNKDGSINNDYVEVYGQPKR